MESLSCACSKLEIQKLRLRSFAYLLVLLAYTLSLTSCSQNKVSHTDVEVVADQKSNAKNDEEDKKSNQSKSFYNPDEDISLKRTAPTITNETVGDYNVKLKSGTKTLKGSVDVSHENDAFLHIDIRPDAEVSLFQPDLFGPEKLMVVQVQNPGSVYEYMIIPLDIERAKVDKTFKVFNDPPEIVEGPKNGEFTVAFLEPFPDSGARPIAPCVVLKYKKGKLTLDPKLMKERGKEAELGDVQSIKDAFEMHEGYNDVPAELADEVINRYYLGRAKEARQFFEEAWPKKHKGKKEAWQDIMDQLEQSPYWPQIKAMNKL